MKDTYRTRNLADLLSMGVKGEQERKVIKYYEKTAEEYDKEYEAPYFKKLYDKIT